MPPNLGSTGVQVSPASETLEECALCSPAVTCMFSLDPAMVYLVASIKIIMEIHELSEWSRAEEESR